MTRKIPLEIIIFSLIQAVLYFMIFTIGGSLVRYLVIACAFLFSLIFISRNKNSYITVCALAFTLAADWFLVMLSPARQLAGMIFFCGAQACHALRVHFLFDGRRAKNISLILRMVTTVAVQIVTLCVLGDAYDALSAVSMLYFTNLILNVIFAFIRIRKQPVYAVGLLLFLFCDIFVGLSSAAGAYLAISEGSILYALANPPFDAVWAFYAPSQTLIAISSYCDGQFIKNIKGGNLCSR